MLSVMPTEVKKMALPRPGQVWVWRRVPFGESLDTRPVLVVSEPDFNDQVAVRPISSSGLVNKGKGGRPIAQHMYPNDWASSGIRGLPGSRQFVANEVVMVPLANASRELGRMTGKMLDDVMKSQQAQMAVR